MRVLLVALVIVAAIALAIGSAAIGRNSVQPPPVTATTLAPPSPLVALCAQVHNNVAMPAGVLRDISDLRYDVTHHKPHTWLVWEARVLTCTLAEQRNEWWTSPR
jgi:hypothetical protein